MATLENAQASRVWARSCGVLATTEGECAVLCPTCPQLGKNLPDNWQDAPVALR